jgi:signal transduction histidine kinase
MKQIKYVTIRTLLFAVCLAANVGRLDASDNPKGYIDRVWTEDQGLPNKAVQAVAADSNGYVWLGTPKGLLRFNGVHFASFDFASGDAAAFNFASSDISALCASRSLGLWVGSQNEGLSRRLKNGSTVFYRKQDGLTSDAVRCLFETRDGSVWIGTSGGGLMRFKHDTLKAYTTQQGLASDFVRTIFEDDNGVIWIGTSQGLCQFQDGHFTTFKTGLAKLDVTAIGMDNTHTLWVGTDGGGLYQFKDRAFRRLGEKEGVKSDAVRAIYRTKDGTLWVGFFGGGLCWLQGNSLIRFSQDAYGKELSFAIVHAITEDKNGTLWIGTESGLHAIRNNRQSASPSRVVIEDVQLDSKSADLRNPLTIPVEAETTEFDYTSPTFIGSAILYEYKLDGVNSEWIDGGTEQRAIYKKLPFGNQTFRVRVKDVPESEVSFNFSVEPRFYQTIRFYVFLLVALAVSAFVIYRVSYWWRVSTLKDEEQRLKALVSGRTAELSDTLQQVAEKSKQLENINKIVKAVNSEISFTRMLQLILEEIHVIDGIEAASVLLRQGTSDTFAFKASTGIDFESLKDITFTMAEAEACYIQNAKEFADNIYFWMIIQSYGIYPFDDGKRKGLSPKLAHLPPPKATLIMRIIVNDIIEGYFIFENRTLTSAFSSDDAGLLINLREHIVSTFIKTRLLQEMQMQRDELQATNHTLEDTVRNLKQTQEQLIHAEKMASLGELTAGIAHEIQNPLNFVNNFSDVSADLCKELQTELQKLPLPPNDQAYVTDIIKDLVANMEKISHHGNRASSIVKGMLQHSRKGTGDKSETDLNAMLTEYLNLAYHGYRAKEKSFNAVLVRELEPSLPKLMVVPQDMSRVFLNIINNAFYSVNEKRKALGDGYAPEVKIVTKSLATGVEIRIRDNGKGIPEKIREKILQPFFTTKPTGEGTGLGLSLSYDIIVKGHNGELKVETQEGEYAEFIIVLPKKLSNV